MKVTNGNKVKVHYTGTLDDGTKFDSSEGRDPLEFEVGKGMVIKGFEDGVIDMEVGQEKEIHIKSEDAYGQRNEQLIHKVPRAQLGDKLKLEKGITLAMQAPDGKVLSATVADLTDDEVTLDMNHPLAGKNLNFKLKLVEIN